MTCIHWIKEKSLFNSWRISDLSKRSYLGNKSSLFILSTASLFSLFIAFISDLNITGEINNEALKSKS